MGPDKLPTTRSPSAGLDVDCAMLDVDHCFDGWSGVATLRDAGFRIVERDEDDLRGMATELFAFAKRLSEEVALQKIHRRKKAEDRRRFVVRLEKLLALLPKLQRTIVELERTEADGSAIVFGGVFSYDGAGNPIWLTFGDTFAAGVNSKANIPVNRSSGGTFGTTFTAPTTTAVGTATVTINSCTSMTVALDMNAASTLPDVTLAVSPSQTVLGFPRNALCSETATLAACPTGTTANGKDCTQPASTSGSKFLPAGQK